MPPAKTGAPSPDSHRVVFDSADAGRTAAFLTAAYGTPVKINSSRDHHRFRQVRLGSGPFYVNSIHHGATTDVRAEPFPALAAVRMHRGMAENLVADSRLGPGDLALFGQPGAPNHMRYENVVYTTVVVPLQAVAEVARNRPDDDLGPLRFPSLRPAGAVAARQWQQTVEYVTQNLRVNPDAMSQPLLNDATTRLLAATLLTTFPNTWLAEPHYLDRVDATPTTVSRAIAFIDANADLDISAADIARAGHVTVRAVQLAFRRHLNSTPMAYLRRVRLERAHEQLRAATPADGTTVTDIAARWGYANPSRFTAHYRRVYGQPPSHTLRS